MKVKVTVDRIEDDLAILLIRPEENRNISWPLTYLPQGITEGDILEVFIKKDKNEKEKAEKRVESLIEKLKKKN